ncbi:MAG: carbohydrate ABC transporter permease [Haloarculaceae archaeon]
MSTVDRLLPSRAPAEHGRRSWTLLSVLPVLALYFLVALLPMAFAVYASLFEIGLFDPNWEFVGLHNYAVLLGMAEFWASLWRGAVYAAGSTLLHLAVGLWMALVLNRVRNRFVTAVVFASYLVPIVVVALLTLFLLDPWVGAFHVVGAEWLGLWPPDRYVLGHPSALPIAVVVLAGTWKYAAFVTIFALAQLRSIPPKLYDAARIAGANRWQQFRDVTLPRIRGVVLVVALLRLVFTFNKFDIIYMLTRGGPGDATTTLPMLAYSVTFGAHAFGLGNAIAVAMFLVLAMGAVAFFFVFRPSEDVETTA